MSTGRCGVMQPIAFTNTASTLRAGAGAPKHFSDIVGRLACEKVPHNAEQATLSTPQILSYSFDCLSSNSIKSQNPVFENENVSSNNPVCYGTDGCNNTLTGKQTSTLGSNCETSSGRCGIIQPANLKTIDVEMEVSVRKFQVDKDGLVSLLRKHKGNKTNKEIAQYLNKPLTLVEHWFRNDKSFSIPAPDVWFKLKELLGITTSEYDQSITQFQLKNSNYDLHNRIYANNISPTLTCECGNYLHLIPQKNTFDTALQNSFVLFEPRSQDGIPRLHNEVAPTLNTAQGGQRQPCIAFPTDTTSKSFIANFTASLTIDNKENSQAYHQSGFADYAEGIGGTLKASGGDLGGGSENLITEQKPSYIVRRLTPTECARLQGFPDYWGWPDFKEDFSDEEFNFWLDVRNTHALMNNKKARDYTKKQLLAWYNKLHSDSAEYKMWGNGVALPPTLYCMQGIYDALTQDLSPEGRCD
ncbi:MAG: DNA cytosine methyltransferase [Lachnospiraceae bacterium]|nr:DNA cytosine methyltransferase [Lachnospiraceae bacterium]